MRLRRFCRSCHGTNGRHSWYCVHVGVGEDGGGGAGAGEDDGEGGGGEGVDGDGYVDGGGGGAGIALPLPKTQDRPMIEHKPMLALPSVDRESDGRQPLQNREERDAPA